MIKSVYKITDNLGHSYIGSTNRPQKRIFEHKSNLIGLDKKSAKIEVICTCKNYEKLEAELVGKELSNNPLCLNKTKTGKSGANFVNYPERLRTSNSEKLKERWKNPEQRKIFMAGIAKSKLVNDVIAMNKKANEVKIGKMPEYIAICKKTGKIFGPYKGYKQAIIDTGCSLDAIFKTLKHGNNNRKFEFKYLRGAS